MQRNKNDKIIHLIIIIIGIVFITIPVFHSNLWFDESYSVALSNHTFKEIWTIGGKDVHPVLYYWVLHILNLIFGNRIQVYRLFSTICMVLLGILGFSHIRKDFGKNTGIIFSYLTFFLPVNVVYAGEIRMYSMAMLLVTLMGIYAYRIYINRDEKNIKNWILFSIFSLSSAYTHYYALMVAGLVNLLLFISIVIDFKKKNKITYNFKIFFISAFVQVIVYLPWIIFLLFQVNEVSQGFWISITFPDILIEFFEFLFVGNLEDNIYISSMWSIIFGLIICIYLIAIHRRNKASEELKIARYAIKLWVIVVIVACVISILMKTLIIYPRYMLCAQGLFIFFIAHTISKKGIFKINITICIISFIVSIVVLGTLVQENYAYSNKELLNYLKENIKIKDIIIGENKLSGFIVSANFPNNKFYFYNKLNWNGEDAYKAYGQIVYNLEFLEDFKGRLWIVDTIDYELYNEINKKYNIEKIQQECFFVAYKKYQYILTLIVKK